MKNNKHLLIGIILLSFSQVLHSQNLLSNLIRSMDRAVEAVTIFKSNRQPPYLIRGTDSEGYIVYDVYGIDVRVTPPYNAEIIFRTDLQQLNIIYETLLEQLLFSFGRPTMNARRATFVGGSDTRETRTDYKYILDYYPHASNVTLKYEKTVISKNESTLMSQSQTINKNDLDIRIERNSVIILKYKGTSRNVTIPDRIDGLTVTEIGTSAFYNKKLQSVVIPQNVTSIGNQAFAMNELTSIILPTNIRSIGEQAFNNNRIERLAIPNGITEISKNAFRSNRLIEITLPNSVTNIGAWAFSGNRLSNITLPNSITTIGDVAFGDNPLTSVLIPSSVNQIQGNPFAYCRAIKEIIVDHNNQQYKSIDGVVFSKDETHIIAYPSGKGNRYTIPSTVNKIGDSAFRNCSLIQIFFPENINSIGSLAFYENQLESIVIPYGVNYLGVGAFNNNKLSNVIIQSTNIKSIGLSTFSQNNLSQITLPADLSFEIGGECFTRDFDVFYNNNGKRAGTYRYTNGKWNVN